MGIFTKYVTQDEELYTNTCCWLNDAWMWQ